jgi:hypothetical protein
LLVDSLGERSPLASTDVELVPRTPYRSGVAPFDATGERLRIDDPDAGRRHEYVIDIAACARYLAVVERYYGIADLAGDERGKRDSPSLPLPQLAEISRSATCSATAAAAGP